MSSAWHRLAEDRINEAIARGDFADAPRGQSLDLDEYFRLPASERAALTLLRNAGAVPLEVTLLKEVNALESALAACPDAASRAELTERLQTARVALAMQMERNRSRARNTEL